MTASLQALHALILDGNLNEAARMCDQLTAQQCKGCDVPQDGVYAISEPKSAAVQRGVQPPFMYAIADGYGQPFFEEQGCVSSEAKDLQPEVDSLNQNLDGEPPYKVVALYTHPTQQGE